MLLLLLLLLLLLTLLQTASLEVAFPLLQLALSLLELSHLPLSR